MNGPEHYTKAEELLSFAAATERGDPSEQSLLAEAQVHATLAVAAATAMRSDGYTPREWTKVMGS